MNDTLTTPLLPQRQPGFGPREIDPPVVQGHLLDLPEARDDLVSRQPKTDTMEAADVAVDTDAPEMAEPQVVRLDAAVGLPKANPA